MSHVNRTPCFPDGMLYHGAASRDAAEAICRDGLKPGSLIQGRGRYDPQAGRSYLTRRLGVAVQSVLNAPNLKEINILAFAPETDLGDVAPDEDSVAEFVRDRLEWIDTFVSRYGLPDDDLTAEAEYKRRKAELIANLHRDEPDLFVTKSGIPYRMKTPDPAERYAVEAIANAMSPTSLDGIVRRDMRDFSAAGGKQALKRLSTVMKAWLANRPEINLAVTGAPRPIAVWRANRISLQIYCERHRGTRGHLLGLDTWERAKLMEPIMKAGFETLACPVWTAAPSHLRTSRPHTPQP